MATTSKLSLPSLPAFDPSSFSDSGSLSGGDTYNAPPKFPHTRAQLSAIARQNKPPESYDTGDEFSGVTTEFVGKIVGLLDEEHEDELKDLLKGVYGMDDDTLEQNVLDLMHKHRDDVAGVPFLFLTPTRRPISRPSSRASSHSTRLIPARPDTPNSAPSSPLAMVFRRPTFPATSPLSTGLGQPSSYMTAKSESPNASPTLSHAQTAFTQQYASSLPSSPLSSPRLLNAKASEFKPIPRPLSAAASHPSSFAGMRAETPSPDLWAHNSPRATSNLAIAAPLVPDQSLLTRSLTPNSSLRSSLRPLEGSDDEDPFDPFAAKAQAAQRAFHSITVSDFDTPWSNSSNSSPEDLRALEHAMPFGAYQYDTDEFSREASPQPPPSAEEQAAMEAEAAALLTDGMTPFDVLSSVFGSTLAPSELEDALAANGYDFERAMGWLVDRALPPVSQGGGVRMQQMGGRVTLVSRDGSPGGRGGVPITAPGRGASPRYVNGRPVQGGNRVCRYFVAGECLRADCRFSHDLERALCRFWLRGTCAKAENCEFLHHLPKDVDVSHLTAAINRANINPAAIPRTASSPPPDDFPVLGMDNGKGNGARRGGAPGYDRSYQDPGRTRFAAAVKKSASAPTGPSPSLPSHANDPTLVARREAMGPSAESLHHRSAIVAPRSSPRLKLRQPSLMPTLPTGESVNALYMAYRSRALQLGAARNACLSRAADAWRRGDGAAAKRFSREGHDLNAKMGAEMAGAAGRLVRERAKVTEQAVRARDAGWSDDPGDRTSRGRSCGGGLGVCLGIASRTVGDGKLTPEERTESMLDLHGLHSNEATEVLEEFLLALEQEHFYGLAYVVVGEEKHTGTQDVARGASRARLATGVREWVHRWGYPWSERDGIIVVDPLTHAS